MGDGALSVVRDGLKSTLKLSVMILDMMLAQVNYSIYTVPLKFYLSIFSVFPQPNSKLKACLHAHCSVFWYRASDTIRLQLQ